VVVYEFTTRCSQHGAIEERRQLGKPLLIAFTSRFSLLDPSGLSPIANIQTSAYLASDEIEWRNKMKNCMIVTCLATSALALSLLLVGCDREVSNTKSSTVSDDGTVKSKEKTVTQSPDGTVTKTEESTKTTPPEKP
jgi:hypothetical protein